MMRCVWVRGGNVIIGHPSYEHGSSRNDLEMGEPVLPCLVEAL
jgi:hypothetical protein